MPSRDPLLLKNARLLDPANNLNEMGSVYIEDGKIVDVGGELEIEGVEVVDVGGKYIFPAFCDPHVHFRTPGQTHKEDLESGSRAALAGGFTSVIQMPNTNPTIDTAELVGQVTRDEPIELKVMGAVTFGLDGRELTEFQALKDAGAVSLTDDGQPVNEMVFMQAAVRFSAESGIPVASHAEDQSIGLSGVVRIGQMAESLGVPGWNPQREAMMVKRDCLLSKKLGGKVHICHVSVADSVEYLRTSREKGYEVTSEVTPHHLLLSVDDVGDLGENGKMNPPLGVEKDREVLLQALSDGVIDCIATDHAPHTPEEKSQGLMRSPFGVIGLETSFSVMFSEFVLKEKLGLDRLIDAMTSSPRRIFGLEPVGLVKGSGADLVIVDPDMKWTVDPEKFESKSRNCPFAGMELTGRVVKTIRKGEILWEI